MMVRAVVLASIASACVSCKPAPPATTIGHGSSTLVVPDRAPPPRAGSSPLAVLTARVHAKVTVEGKVDVPGGVVLVYTYDRLEARIGERTAAGHDVATELAQEQQHCEDERAGLDPAEREQLELESRGCEAVAGAALFADEQLAAECRALGVARFDAAGQLLGDVALGGPCLQDLHSFEAYDLTPEPTDEVLLLATFATFGELEPGGWGRVREATHVHVLGLPPDGESRLVSQLDVELDVVQVGSVCNTGIRRSLRVAGPGRLEVFSQDWNDCEAEHCVDAEQAAGMLEDEDADAIPVCESRPVAAAITAWSPEGRAWSRLEPVSYAGTALPDGIMR